MRLLQGLQLRGTLLQPIPDAFLLDFVGPSLIELCFIEFLASWNKKSRTVFLCLFSFSSEMSSCSRKPGAPNGYALNPQAVLKHCQYYHNFSSGRQSQGGNDERCVVQDLGRLLCGALGIGYAKRISQPYVHVEKVSYNQARSGFGMGLGGRFDVVVMIRRSMWAAKASTNFKAPNPKP